jgi:hypothetical protein
MTFKTVTSVGLALPDVEVSQRWSGPTLTTGGVFVAGIAAHASAEPQTLVVRCEFEDRARLIEDAPGTYYVTEFYERYPLVLARLTELNQEALRDLLSVSRRLALEKTPKGRRSSYV